MEETATHSSYRVTAWSAPEEWLTVHDWVLADDVSKLQRAVREISVWKSRVDRLPAGIETTLCLLEGVVSYALHPGDSAVSLTLATCINRFLNLVSHTGFNLLGLTKYYDVAHKFHIPDWIVDVRHETTHGHMPSKELLLEALAFCLNWIRTNYWRNQVEVIAGVTAADGSSGHDHKNRLPLSAEAATEIMKETAAYKNLHNSLDCYMYLKIYTAVWGGTVEFVGDLADQELLYDHVVALLRGHDSVRKRYKNLDDSVNSIKIKEAANIARSSVHSFLSGVKDKDAESGFDKAEMLLENLVSEELMLPAKDFLRSLLGNDQETEQWSSQNIVVLAGNSNSAAATATRKLPENLIKVWSDVLQMMAASSKPEMLVGLLDKLFAVATVAPIGGGQDEASMYEQALACSWIAEICDSLHFARENNDIEKTTAAAFASKKNKNKKASKKNSVNQQQPHRNTIIRFSGKTAQEVPIEAFCRRVLNDPGSIRTLSFLGSVLQLVSCSESKKSLVRSLMEMLLLGSKKSSAASLPSPDAEEVVKTLDDLNRSFRDDVTDNDDVTVTSQEDDASENSEKESSESIENCAWKLCDGGVKWEDVPFGLCPDDHLGDDDGQLPVGGKEKLSIEKCVQPDDNLEFDYYGEFNENLAFLQELESEGGDVAKINWDDIKPVKRTRLPPTSPSKSDGMPPASPLPLSSGPNSSAGATSDSDDDEEEEEGVGAEGRGRSVVKPLKTASLKQVPAFYRSQVQSMNRKRSGNRKRKSNMPIEVESHCSELRNEKKAGPKARK